jgi:hypothetical protein
MYNRYAETAGLKIEDLESSPSELGGLKETIFKISANRFFGSCVMKAASIACNACPRPKRRAGSTLRPRPSLFYLKPRKSIWSSSRKIFGLKFAAPAVRAGRA